MAAGRPVLGTSVAFRGMTVRAGEDCAIEDDLARWPEAIAALLADPARAAAIGAAGQRVAQAYDHRRVYAGYDALLGLPPLPAPDAKETALRRIARERRLTLDFARQALSAHRPDLALQLLANLPPGSDPLDIVTLITLAGASLSCGSLDLAEEVLDGLPQDQLTLAADLLLKLADKAIQLGSRTSAVKVPRRLEPAHLLRIDGASACISASGVMEGARDCRAC